jgi:peptide/nickel transport system permease protein
MAKKVFGFFNKQKQFEQDVMENGMQYSSFYGDSLRRLKKNKMAMFCAGLLILLVLMAIFAPLIAPYDPTFQDYSAVLSAPSMAHPFGTDEFGRDILSRIIYGSRVSISIGIVAQVIASIVGVTLGSLAGYYGGWIDNTISRIMEIFQAWKLTGSAPDRSPLWSAGTP